MDRRVFLTAAGAGAGSLLARGLVAGGIPGRVEGDAAVTAARLDRRLYGQNLEFIARVMEGGLLAEPGSQAPPYGPGFRADVRDALIELGATHFRWPGGCFADAYHWRDGTGPERSRQRNPMWGHPVFKVLPALMGEFKAEFGTEVNHAFGTDEFLDFCRLMGAEPCLTASMEADAPDEAAAWVAYVRDRFEPDAVPVWAVGNEQWNIFEHNGNIFRPQRYVQRFQQWAEAMRRENPRLKLIASGADPQAQPEWNRVLLAGLGREMDYISYHMYLPACWGRSRIPTDEATYLALAASYLYVEDSLKLGAEAMTQILGATIPVSLDEWNLLATAMSFIKPETSVREAVAAAGIIHALHRHADMVPIADQFSAINSAAPAIITDRDHIALTPMFYTLRLYTRNRLANTSPLHVTSPTFSTKKTNRLPARDHVPFLDASLTIENNRAALFLINRHPRECMEIEIAIAGLKPGRDATLEVVTGPDFNSQNQLGAPPTVTSVFHELPWPERLNLPPCAIAALTTG